MSAKVRYKGRDYTVAIYHIEYDGEVVHRVQIVASPTGKNVRVYLDDQQMTLLDPETSP